MAKVFIPDPVLLKQSGFARWAHVPVLFDDHGNYLREHSRYLRERATRIFSPGSELKDYPRHQTLKAIAYHIADFSRWTAATLNDWRTVTYDAVIAYQNDLLYGRCSASGRPLNPKTANALADDANHFLHWASINGLRPTFTFETRHSNRWVDGKLHTSVVRFGRAREYSFIDHLAPFPTPAEVRDWLDAVRRTRGEAKWLACRFVLETGVRKSEVAYLKKTDWPTTDAISEAMANGSAYVHMILRHGTKGGKHRQIRLPVSFAIQVREWMKRRNTYEYRFYKHNGTRPDRMFLSDSGDHAGTPLSGNTIWRCFHEVKPRPARWKTHLGRHAYAVFLVLHELEMEAAASGSTLGEKNVEWIHDRGKYWLLLLRTQFGHASEETTQMYLKWLVTAAAITEISQGWHRFLNGEQ